MADGTQVPQAWDRQEILSLFDPASGVLDRRVHSRRRALPGRVRCDDRANHRSNGLPRQHLVS